MRVCKIGDGLAIPLPEDVVAALRLKEGDLVDVHRDAHGHLVIERRRDPAAMVEALRAFRGMTPADYKFDRDEANER